MDEFLALRWPEILDELAIAANPMLDAMIDALGRGLYWTTWQAEWATDVMFKDAATLADCYPSFVRYATEGQPPRAAARRGAVRRGHFLHRNDNRMG